MLTKQVKDRIQLNKVLRSMPFKRWRVMAERTDALEQANKSSSLDNGTGLFDYLGVLGMMGGANRVRALERQFEREDLRYYGRERTTAKYLPKAKKRNREWDREFFMEMLQRSVPSQAQIAAGATYLLQPKELAAH